MTFVCLCNLDPGEGSKNHKEIHSNDLPSIRDGPDVNLPAVQYQTLEKPAELLKD